MTTATAPRPARTDTSYDRPLYVGSWFGFAPIEAPKVTAADLAAVAEFGVDRLAHPALRAAFLRSYLEQDLASRPHPLSLSYRFKNPENKPEHKTEKKSDYIFELAGFQSGAAEALLIRTVLSILAEEGHTALAVELNSIGDKDSIIAYERELANTVKRHSDLIDPEARKALRGNLFDAFELLRGAPAYEHLPPSIASLSTNSRAHFKDVLEHVESLGADFRLAPDLLPNRHYASETAFRIKDAAGKILAFGSRASRLSKKLGFKREVPFSSATIAGDARTSEKTYKELPRPKFSLIQLGPSAHLKTLPLLELLRQNRIAVHHSFGQDKLSPQLEAADRTHVPYLLIIGQKEALEDAVTVRNVSSRAQDTVPVGVLPEFLKHLPF